MAKRSYGSGSLYVRRDAAGQESWYGHWRQGVRQVKRKLGPKRVAGSRDGLTRSQAEAELRRQIAETQVRPRVSGEAPTVAEVAARYVVKARRAGRKPSTLEKVESVSRVHLEPFFGDRALGSITSSDVLDLVSTLEGKGLAPKSIRDIIGTLSGLFNFAKAPQRRWSAENPCEGLELPAAPETTEVRFLTLEEVDAAVANVPDGLYQEVDRALILTAAMTGLRKGELVALRWRDVDWVAGRIRVRQNYVRGQFGTPKSKRSTRSVPMADEIGGALERLFKQSRFQADDDLVFTLTGDPQPKANITRRFRKALKAAGLDDSHRFHDLRHTFGTRMAATGEVPMRTLQEWMGHRDLATTQIYADYAPSVNEGQMVARAFARGSNSGSNLSESQVISENLKPSISRENATT
jgi:integrase